MDIPAKMLEVLNHEGVVAIVTQGEAGPHVVNTWNSYVTVTPAGDLLVPAGRMKVTEANIARNDKVLVTLGSRDVEGLHSKGAGFRLAGTAKLLHEGAEFESLKGRFPWLRAVLLIRPGAITQTL